MSLYFLSAYMADTYITPSSSIMSFVFNIFILMAFYFLGSANSLALFILFFFFFFFLIFSHLYVGSMCLVRRLHLARSCSSSPDNSLSDKSFLILSNHLHFGLPLLLFLGTSIPITLFPTYLSTLLNTCPYHFNPLYCTFLDISPNSVALILSFLILSILVTPLIHLNFGHIQLLLVRFLHCPRLGTVHHCWSYNCLVCFPLDSQTYSSVTENPRYPLLVFPS